MGIERPQREYTEKSLNQRANSKSQTQRINLTKVHTINLTRDRGQKATMRVQERKVVNYKGRRSNNMITFGYEQWGRRRKQQRLIKGFKLGLFWDRKEGKSTVEMHINWGSLKTKELKPLTLYLEIRGGILCGKRKKENQDDELSKNRTTRISKRKQVNKIKCIHTDQWKRIANPEI